jgi:hypothetical protein
LDKKPASAAGFKKIPCILDYEAYNNYVITDNTTQPIRISSVQHVSAQNMSSSSNTNCTKYKREYIQIALLELRPTFLVCFILYHVALQVQIGTIVAIGNEDAGVDGSKVGEPTRYFLVLWGSDRS